MAMTGVNSRELLDMAENLEKEALTLFQNTAKKLGTGDFWIAGGALRSIVEGVNNNDIDCFFNNSDSFHKAKESLMWGGFIEIKKRNNSIVYSDGNVTYDLIYTPSVINGKGIIEDFDFTNCCAAYGREGLNTHPDFFGDVSEKVLRINKTKLPFHTLQRAIKFIKSGYELSVVNRLVIFQNLIDSSMSADEEKEYDMLTSNSIPEKTEAVIFTRDDIPF